MRDQVVSDRKKKRKKNGGLLHELWGSGLSPTEVLSSRCLHLLSAPLNRPCNIKSKELNSGSTIAVGDTGDRMRSTHSFKSPENQSPIPTQGRPAEVDSESWPEWDLALRWCCLPVARGLCQWPPLTARSWWHSLSVWWRHFGHLPTARAL